LILQVCEVYSDVSENEKLRKKEIDFIKSADKYIFSSVLLEKKLNADKKPYAICMGTYEAQKTLAQPINDGKIHIVYAGTFNTKKGGVINAIDCTEYLDEKYHMHLLGGADDLLLKHILKRMIQTSVKTSCEISYDGYLSGETYNKALQLFHIGLSTQNAKDAFNETSFPSKILTYLSNDLRVVSSKSSSVITSSIGDKMYYYEEDTPESLANAIKSININEDFSGKNIVSSLNLDFINSLRELLE
jgi:hypothetical protein